jgi:hypothetical protein
MITQLDLRHALAPMLGQTLTPEVAAAIEAAAMLGQERSIDWRQFPITLYNGLVFSAESFRNIVDEMHVLHKQHFAETERYHEAPMVPDYDALRADERRGGLIQFTVRHSTNLVGNARFYVSKSRHIGELIATEDTFFLLPAYRKGFTAIRFWQFCERCLDKIDVYEVRTDSKVANDVGRLNEYLGYELIANRYVKRLRESEVSEIQELATC